MNKFKKTKTYLLLIAILAGIGLVGCAVAGVVDTTAPTVISTVPVDAATGVAVSANITATFSEGMDAATITATTFTLKQGSAAVAGSVTYSGTTATFNPTANLANSTVYTATITTGAKDAAGNAMAAAEVWTFTTAAPPDMTAPTAVSTFPVDSATGVAVNSIIAATFGEPMNAATIVAANFSVTNGGAVPGTVTYDIGNMKAIFAPSVLLAENTTYTATVTTVAADISGNTLVADKIWTFTTIATAGAGPDPVVLGTAGNFVILAKAGISTVPSSIITGNVGLSPAAESYLTGFSQTDATGYATSSQVTGFIYAADMAPPTPATMTTAISDMETAYAAANAVAAGVTELGAGEIGGMTLVPGVYSWGTGLGISTDLTLNGAANDVWIFQVAQGITVPTGVQVILSGGAQAKNIFWTAGEAVTLEAGSHFEGIVLGQTLIAVNTGATINGRLFAQTEVTLDQNTVTQPAP
jgi:hypothetical protein